MHFFQLLASALLITALPASFVSVADCIQLQKRSELDEDSSTKSSSPREEMAAPSAVIAVSNGTEDIEAVTCVDVLRRAGINVTVASVAAAAEDGSVVFANKLKVVPDSKVTDLAGKSFDVIVLPGGMPGAEHLQRSPELTNMLKKQNEEKKLIAAICASPKVVLEHHGILGELPSTGYPSFKTKNYKEQSVVEAGHIITSRGPGTAMAFALTIVERLTAKENRSKLESQMLVLEA